MKSSHILNWLISFVLLNVSCVTTSVGQTVLQSHNKQTSAAAKLLSSPQSGLADSSGKVTFDVRRTKMNDKADHFNLAVVIKIAPGWHINAHPASLPFLIPTSVTASVNGKRLHLEPRYPSGVDSGIHLNGKAIEVYGNGVRILLNLRSRDRELINKAGKIDIKLRVQSCSDNGVCLAPSTIEKTLPLTASSNGLR